MDEYNGICYFTSRFLPITDFQLFPNPVQEVFIVKGNLEEKQNVSLQLVNLLGQTVLQQDLGNIQQFEENIDLSLFPNGSYVLILQSDNGDRVAYKVLKNKGN